MKDHIYRVLILSYCMILASCGGTNLGTIPTVPDETGNNPNPTSPPDPVVIIETDTAEPGTNLAIGSVVTQSTTVSGGVAERAIDGNTDGVYRNESVTHTESGLEPWWQVDIGSVQDILNINIYNRIDACCITRLSNFYVLVSETPFESNLLQDSLDQAGVTSYYYGPGVASSTTFSIETAARYIRIQKVGQTNALSLAEVEVIAGSKDDPIEEPEIEITTVPSPLSRLSNIEFVNSIRASLNLADDSPFIEAAIPLMASESISGGLTNDANAQNFSTAAISGYITVAIAAANDFIGDATTIAELEELMQCEALQEASGRNDYSHLICTRDFFRTFVEKLYGVPYTNDAEFFDTFVGDIETYRTAAGLVNESFETTKFRLQTMFSYMFLVPEFLVFLEEEPEVPSATGDLLSSTEIAKRLAFFITGTLPDEALRQAALEDTLTDPNIRLDHAIRLLESSEVNEQFAKFFVGWLGVSIENDQVEQEDIDALTTWLTNWFSNSEPFSNLYSSSANVLNINGSESSMNVGVLGFKALVASMTNNPVPSFINRGDFVVTRLLCADLPDDIPSSAFADETTVSETPEDLFHELGNHPCASCHHIADNYGALFQQFTSENSLFDAELSIYGESFNLSPVGDIEGEFSDLTSFAQTLGESQSAAECASKLLYRHSVRRSIEESDSQALEAMYANWVSSGDTSIKSLLRTIVTSDHFVTRFN